MGVNKTKEATPNLLLQYLRIYQQGEMKETKIF